MIVTGVICVFSFLTVVAVRVNVYVVVDASVDVLVEDVIASIAVVVYFVVVVSVVVVVVVVSQYPRGYRVNRWE